MPDDWHTRVCLNTLDEGPSAARDNDIDTAAKSGQHMPNGGPIGCWHFLDRVFRQSGFGQRLTQQIGNCARGVCAFRAAA